LPTPLLSQIIHLAVTLECEVPPPVQLVEVGDKNRIVPTTHNLDFSMGSRK
jgi:hypothetical protein